MKPISRLKRFKRLAESAIVLAAFFMGLSCLSLARAQPNNAIEEGPILERFPELNTFISKERSSGLFFGFGVSPVTLVNGKFGVAASLFQLHNLSDPWDIEILNLSFGSAFGEQYSKSDFFLLRTAPKFKIFKNLSIGPVGGIEFVRFPEVQAQVTKDGDFTKPFNFSTFGYFYGVALSHSFSFGDSREQALRVTALYFQEKYSVTETENGWTYYFYQPTALNADRSKIAPASLFMLEVSYLY